jgi:hypothetical protein
VDQWDLIAARQHPHGRIGIHTIAFIVVVAVPVPRPVFIIVPPSKGGCPEEALTSRVVDRKNGEGLLEVDAAHAAGPHGGAREDVDVVPR